MTEQQRPIPDREEPGGVWEEGIYISPYTQEYSDYLAWVLLCLDAGEEHLIGGDLWYKRPEGLPPITDELVDRVITALDDEYGKEMTGFRMYHFNRSKATHAPEFSRLSPRARRFVVEQLDSIVFRHYPPTAPAVEE